MVTNLELYVVDHLNVTMGWDPPESVIRTVSDYYCIFINYGIGSETKCRVRHNEFTLRMNYELDYHIKVGAVNKVGAGELSSLSILVPSKNL